MASSRLTRFSRRVSRPYLSFWAALVTRRRRPRIVGITGSVGKTTTTEVIAAVLAHPELRPFAGTVRKTTANMNSNRGVPMTVLGYRRFPPDWRLEFWYMVTAPLRALAYVAGLRAYPDTLVLEFGAGPGGDIPRLARIAPPTVAIVTAVGPAHLEWFGTVERIIEVKGGLVRAVPATGLVLLGADSDGALAMERLAVAPVRRLPGRGRELAERAAHAVGEFLGAPPDVVARAVAAAVVTVPGRMQVERIGRLTLIDDAYNANPLSVRFGLDSIAGHARPGQRRVAILGTMAELGPDAPRFHAEVGAHARTRADLVIGVGDVATAYAPDHWFATSADCVRALPSLVRADDCVFVKGSHSVGLRAVARALRERAAAPDRVGAP